MVGPRIVTARAATGEHGDAGESAVEHHAGGAEEPVAGLGVDRRRRRVSPAGEPSSCRPRGRRSSPRGRCLGGSWCTRRTEGRTGPTPCPSSAASRPALAGVGVVVGGVVGGVGGVVVGGMVEVGTGWGGGAGVVTGTSGSASATAPTASSGAGSRSWRRPAARGPRNGHAERRWREVVLLIFVAIGARGGRVKTSGQM